MKLHLKICLNGSDNTINQKLYVTISFIILCRSFNNNLSKIKISKTTIKLIQKV